MAIPSGSKSIRAKIGRTTASTERGEESRRKNALDEMSGYPLAWKHIIGLEYLRYRLGEVNTVRTIPSPAFEFRWKLLDTKVRNVD